LNTAHSVLASFDPYAASKLLRYMFAFNDSSEHAVELYKSISLLLTQIVQDRQRALINAKLDDPLIDLEVHDLVDIVRVYGAFAGQSKKLPDSVPPLFLDESTSLENDELEAFENKPTRGELGEMSLHLLKTLQGPILKKISPNRVVNVSEPSLANIADIIFAYSTASPDMLD